MRAASLLCLLPGAAGCMLARVKIQGSDEPVWAAAAADRMASEEEEAGGRLPPGTLWPLSSAQRTLAGLLREGGAAAAQQACGGDGGVSFGAVAEWLPPVTADAQKLMLGVNYAAHAAEAGLTLRDGKTEFNMMFPKLSASTGPFAAVRRPPHVRFLDYEVEMGVVLSRDLSEPAVVTPANVGEFVAGIVLVHDFTARGVQLNQQQWVKGKGYRSFGPVGPFVGLVNSSAAWAAVSSSRVQLWVNGQLRQDANTADLIHDVAASLTEMSHAFDFRAGDVLMTGTPSGPVVGRDEAGRPASPPKALRAFGQGILRDNLFKVLFRTLWSKRPWLRNGDVVTAALSNQRLGMHLGVTRNVIEPATEWVWRDRAVTELPVDWADLLTSAAFVVLVFAAGAGAALVCCGPKRRHSKLE
eukprot:TRINITY_DN404_c0_g1_i1.p2 TRINITY_DN404_c0_g1~~TRINITY_DN404_c0_g1_i1.p2  ORF type:complete len:413 (+),score=168.86 TRINITY_DN404_c0_g1_i1:60-1298(+)